MRLKGLVALLPLVAASYGLTGCDKAKSALQEALGVRQLEDSEIAEMKKAAGWDDAKLPKLKAKVGFELEDNFKGDFAKEVAVPIPLDVPDQAQGAAAGNDKNRAYYLMKLKDFTVGEGANAVKVSRFQIVAVAYYDFESKELKIDGGKTAEFMDKADRVNLANKNQAGKYIIVEGSGSGGLAYLTGVIDLKKNDGTTAFVGGALMFTTEDPFVTTTNSENGKFLLGVVDKGSEECVQKGLVTASHPTIGTKYSVVGTPTSVSGAVPCVGVLDKYKGQLDAKVQDVGGSSQQGKVDTLFNKANKVVTDFLGLWKTGEINMTFVQPPPPPATPPPAPPAPPATPADPAVPVPPADPTPPVASDPVDPVPPADSPIVRGDPAGPQSNLGCTFFGFDSATGLENSLIGDPTKFDDATVKGWRFFGDVRITDDFAETFFGAAETRNAGDPRNISKENGYCLLTTGNSRYNKTQAAYFAPKSEQVSEMWQKVAIPADAKAIQIRVAFFSQEYPEFVGTEYNDAFYVRFDESPTFIANGNLNDLAGDPAAASGWANCRAKSAGLAAGEDHACGEWNNITKVVHGELWGIDDSTEAPKKADKFKCGAGGPNKRCYHGMIQPRVICRPILPEELGKTLTLRIGVTDVGDGYYDSALAVDEVVFSKQDNPCGNIFSGDPESPASRYDDL